MGRERIGLRNVIGRESEAVRNWDFPTRNRATKLFRNRRPISIGPKSNDLIF